MQTYEIYADTQQGFQLVSVSVRDRSMQESSELSHVQKSERHQHTQQGFQLAHVSMIGTSMYSKADSLHMKNTSMELGGVYLPSVQTSKIC